MKLFGPRVCKAKAWIIVYFFSDASLRQVPMTQTLKKDKNPAQMVIKLLMNSMYGKTILKPIEVDTVTIPEWRINKYLD